MNRFAIGDRPLGRQRVIGHRGACAYAPEHTLASYELALWQGVDAVEQDLHVTKDGVLVCLHDRSLERTTNVRDVFPGRSREVFRDGRPTREWLVHDFTYEELTELDAGGWFGRAFAGASIPRFQDIIDLLGEQATHCTELKDPDIYETLGVDLLALFATVLRRNGLDRPRSGVAPVTMQTFHEPTVRRAASVAGERVPRVLLIEPADAPEWASRERVRGVAAFATGIGPGKAILEDHPDLVRWAHEAGLIVTPWTFRASLPGRFDSVRSEMDYYLSVLDVDAVITDNPDQSPRVPEWAVTSHP